MSRTAAATAGRRAPPSRSPSSSAPCSLPPRPRRGRPPLRAPRPCATWPPGHRRHRGRHRGRPGARRRRSPPPPGPVTGEPRFPAWDERWGDAEIVEAGPVERRPAAEGGPPAPPAPGRSPPSAPATSSCRRRRSRCPGRGHRRAGTTAARPLHRRLGPPRPAPTRRPSRPDAAGAPRAAAAGARLLVDPGGAGALLPAPSLLLWPGAPARRPAAARRRGPPPRGARRRARRRRRAEPARPRPAHVPLSLALRRFLGRRVRLPGGREHHLRDPPPAARRGAARRSIEPRGPRGAPALRPGEVRPRARTAARPSRRASRRPGRSPAASRTTCGPAARRCRAGTARAGGEEAA